MEPGATTAPEAQKRPTKFTDRTEEFRAFVKTIKAWHAVHDPAVSMESLIAAPEMFDPKTDSGLGWENTTQLSALVKSEAVPRAKDLSAAQTLDVMDVLLALEAEWMASGDIVATIGQCAYFRDTSLLEGATSVDAFIKAILRGLGIHYTLLATALIHEEEEFSSYPPPEVNVILSESDETAFAVLIKAIDAESDAEVKARLQWRAALLRGLEGVVACTHEGTVSAAAAFEAATIQLETLQRSAPLAPHASIFHSDSVKWWTTPMPIDRVPVPAAFDEVVAQWRGILGNYSAVTGMIEQRLSLGEIPLALERFTGRTPAPLVPHRAAMVITVINPANGAVLQREGKHITAAIAASLAEDYGAPIYLQLLMGDQALLRDTKRYFETHSPARAMPFELADHLNACFEELATLHSAFFAAIVRNRGRYHRSLANILQRSMTAQRMAEVIDEQFLCARTPLGGAAGSKFTPEQLRKATAHCSVLSAYVNDLVFAVGSRYLELTQELDLPTPAELVPLLHYRTHILNVRLNVATQAAIGAEEIPPPRVNQKTHLPLFAPALYSRRPPGPAMGRRDALVELSRMFVAAATSTCAALASTGALSPANPPESRMTVADTFNFRLASMQAVKPYAQYEQIMASFGNHLANAAPAAHLANALRQFALIGTKAKELAQGAADHPDRERFAALEKHAKKNFVACSLLKSKGDADLSAVKQAFESVAFDCTGPWALPVLLVKLKL